MKKKIARKLVKKKATAGSGYAIKNMFHKKSALLDMKLSRYIRK